MTKKLPVLILLILCLVCIAGCSRLSETAVPVKHNVIAGDATELRIDLPIQMNTKAQDLTPKTSAGARTIDVDPALLQELSAWKKMQAEEELRLGPSYRCNYVDAEHHLASGSKGISRPPGQRVDLVCTKLNGAFISPDIIRWRIRQEGYNSHSFRHTHATLLIEHGASAKGVAGRLGHASTLLTQDLYTHNTAKLQKDTEKIFEQTLQPEMQTKQKCRQNADK